MLHIDVESTDGRKKLFQVVNRLLYLKGPVACILRHAFKKVRKYFWTGSMRRSTHSVK